MSSQYRLATVHGKKCENQKDHWSNFKDVQLGHVYRTLGRMTSDRKCVFVEPACHVTFENMEEDMIFNDHINKILFLKYPPSEGEK